MKTDLKYFQIAFKRLYRSVLGFEEGTDREATVEGIKKDISFRGHSAWILVFSILIASIGLNVNSTAVIIGAMLISPLMGPILGLGLSIGIHDYDTLIRSVKNIGIAICISLLTSTLYFLITPLSTEQPELLARTKPTILDVLVALFGGFAGIIAGSRKEKTNVIPGVAIATALMPPLCTAGYGLANLNMNYFFGAFYLFFINSVFISLSTYVVVKYLKFPVIQFIDNRRYNRYKRIVFSFLFIVIAPSVFIFFNVIQEARFEIRAEKFVEEKCHFEGSDLLSYKIIYNDTLSFVDLYYIGDEVNAEQLSFLKGTLPNYDLVGDKWYSITRNTKIRLHQEADQSIDIEERLSEMNNNLRVNLLEDLFSKNQKEIADKDSTILLLKNKIKRTAAKDSMPLLQLRKEMSYHFPSISKFSFANASELPVMSDSLKIDTVPIFMIDFKKGSNSFKKKRVKEAEEWLRIRLSNDKVRAIQY